MSFNNLVEIMSKLRKECPWDRAQDHDSLKRFLIEETYEVLESIEKKDFNNLKEELGDLMLQVLFHSEIAKENNKFNIDDVIDFVSEKLIRRHPHVFNNIKDINKPKDVEVQWEKIKIKEKEKNRSAIDGVPTAMPSTLQAVRLTEKASRVGFDWKNTDDVIAKIDEEILELKEVVNTNDKAKIKHELGDIFFALSNLSRHLSMDPEEVHKEALNRFRERFKMMEFLAKERGDVFSKLDLSEQEKLWEEAKKRL